MVRKIKTQLPEPPRKTFGEAPACLNSPPQSTRETFFEVAGQFVAIVTINIATAMGFVWTRAQRLFRKRHSDVSLLPSAPKQRVLVVEDDDSFREWLGTQLQTLGYSIHLTRNSREANSALSLSSFAAMIVDSMHGEGLHVLQTACRLHPHMPIVFLTGDMPVGENQVSCDSCSTSVLHKPVGITTLHAELLRVLQRVA